jgi:hypothetical protein
VLAGVLRSYAVAIAVGLVVLLVLLFHLGPRLLNRAYLSVDREWLRFGRGPFPERGRFREPSWNIVSFVADTFEVLPTKRKGAFPTCFWGVRVNTLDGRSLRMPLRFTRGDHAAYVAERLAEVIADAQRQGTAYRQ